MASILRVGSYLSVYPLFSINGIWLDLLAPWFQDIMYTSQGSIGLDNSFWKFQWNFFRYPPEGSDFGVKSNNFFNKTPILDLKLCLWE